jgi:hypothetical protein
VPEDITDMTTLSIATEYKEKIDKFQIIQNPLYEYYIPHFLRNGPRSRIFEILTNPGTPIDIRFFLLEKREFFPLFYFHVPFLCLSIVAIILIVIWHDEILTKEKRAFLSKHKLAILELFVLTSLTLFLLMPIPSEMLSFGMRWYPKTSAEQGRWMNQDGELIMYNSEEKMKKLYLNSSINSYYRDRVVQIYLNEELLYETTAYKDQTTELILPFDFNPGKNIIRFHVNPECDIPNVIFKEKDVRCLSIRIFDPSLDSSNEKIIFSQGWHPKSPTEYIRWMHTNGTIIINATADEAFTLKATVNSFHQPRTLGIYINNNFIMDTIIPTETTNLSIPVEISQEPSIIKFYSKEGCVIPQELNKGNDIRCISIGLSKVVISE